MLISSVMTSWKFATSLVLEKFVQADPKTNVVVAAFTTAYARLQLYDELDMLGERVLYYDTDSVIYLTQPGQPEPPLGNYLAIALTNWVVIILRYLRQADRRIMVMKPRVGRPK